MQDADHERAFHELVLAADRYAELRREYHATRVLLRRLQRYASHDNGCHCNSDDDPTCSCGYYKLLQDIMKI